MYARSVCCLAGAAINTLTAAGGRGWRYGRVPAPEYALYHGDIFIDIGTIPQLARRQGVSPHTIRFYKAPSYLKRIEQRNALDTAMILVKIEED